MKESMEEYYKRRQKEEWEVLNEATIYLVVAVIATILGFIIGYLVVK